MKKTITMLLAGLLPVFAVAQNEMPLTIFGEVHNAGSMKSSSEVYLRSGNSQSAAVENNGILVIPSGIIFESDDSRDGLLLNKGSVVAPGNPSLVQVRKKLGTFKWYFVSFPFDVAVSSITDKQGNPLTLDEDFYLNYYDIEARAQQGLWENHEKPRSHWQDITSPTTVLKKGVGYQLAYDNELHPGGLEIVFPAQNSGDLTKLFSTSNNDKVFDLAYFTGSNPDIANTSWGLNFIGALSTANFRMSSGNLGGYAGWIQYYDAAQENYIDIDINLDTKTLPPYTSFFTQTAKAGEKITYTQQGLRLSEAEAGIRSAARDEADIFILSITDGRYTDRIKVYSGSSYDEGFYSKEDVIKFLSPSANVPKVWIKKENESLLIDKAPYREIKRFSLGVNIETAGEYVFSPEKAYEGNYKEIWLTDHLSGERINLLEEDYFLKVTTPFLSSERFSLEMRLNAPTGLDDLTLGSIHVYAANQEIHVEGCAQGDVISIYNTAGQQVGSYRAEGDCVFIPCRVKGALIVKVTGSTTFKVSKILNH